MTTHTVPTRTTPTPMSTPTPTSTSATPAPPTLAVIVASTREGRFAPVIADWFLSRTGERTDFAVDLIDLADIDLPPAPSHNPGPGVRAELEKVSPRLAAADAFVVLTPEYNHSFPASLKSLIDWHYSEWQAKPVGFVSYGGISGGLRAVEQLRQVFAEMHAVTVRDTVSFHHAHSHFGPDGRHKDPDAANAAATAMLNQLGWWARALSEAKSARAYAA